LVLAPEKNGIGKIGKKDTREKNQKDKGIKKTPKLELKKES